MTLLYALLVGIDAYRASVRPLRGARADVVGAAAYLRSHRAADAGWEPLILVDGQATRSAVISAFRLHLGQARRGDTALFWFSGHGSLTRLPPELAHLEPTGTAQSLVCADSRHGGTPDLLDRELAVLIGEVAAAGAHVVVVLDCCHSESGTRGTSHDPVGGGAEESEPGVRCVSPADRPPDLTALLPAVQMSSGSGSRDGVLAAGPDHVALTACRTDQEAREFAVPGGHRGVFSHALLAELERRGPAASYRELIIGVRNRIENRRTVRPQEPTLSPALPDLVDQPFLGGMLRAPASTLVMRHVRGEWEIDGGSCHGMATDPDDPARVAVYGSDPPLEAEVTHVLPGRSIVTPVGWLPDPAQQYPIVVTRIPLPAATVAMSGDAATIERIVAAMRCAGPNGGPSPHVRPHTADATGPPDLAISTPAPGVVRILGPHGCAPTADIAGVLTGDGVAVAVAWLEHMARWQLIRSLANPLSRLVGAVQVEIVPALPGERIAPAAGRALPADGGTVRLEYRWQDGGWAPPSVFIRLRNTTDRWLYCVLLDLTDRYRMHPDLFDGGKVYAHHTAAVDHGRPIVVSLPPDREPEPGASGTDWLKLLVAEQPFTSAPFYLPRLGEPVTIEPKRSAGLSGVLDRLGSVALYRSAASSTPAVDWTTETITVTTRVPPG